MTIGKAALAYALAATIGLGGAALAQNNPTGTPPGTAQGSAPNLGRGSTTQDTESRGAIPDGAAATGATDANRGTSGGGSADNTRHTEPRTAAAPVAGANSFTEGQARARIRDAGFNDVQDLRLDDQGIWRGRAIRNGQQTGVALDYQGNVAATQR